MAATKAGPNSGSGPRTKATPAKRDLRWNMAALLARPGHLRARGRLCDVERDEVLQVGRGRALQLLEDLLLPGVDAVVDQTAERVGDGTGLAHRQVVDQRLPRGGDRDTAGRTTRVLGHAYGEPLPWVGHRVAVVVTQPQQPVSYTHLTLPTI